MKQKLSVLFIEDNEDHAQLILRLLKKEGYDLIWLRVDTAADMRNALKDNWDIIISDYSMPNFSGYDALQIYLEHKLDIPFILVSGTVGEDIAINMLKNGAHDYIMKDKLNLIVPAVKRELQEYIIRKERNHFYQELKIAQAIVFNSPVVLWRWSMDIDKPVLYVSENIRQFGYTPDDFISGKLLYKQIVHSEDEKQNVMLRNKNLKENKEYYDLEYRVICKDGSIRWVLDQSTVMHNPDGEIEYIQGLLIDITGKKQADNKIIASERRFKELMENMELIAVIIDDKGTIKFCNQYLLNLTGWKYSEIINQNWFDVFLPQDSDLKSRIDKHLKQNEIPSYGENDILTKKGSRKTVVWSNTLLKDADGAIMGIASIGQDITDRIRIEKELEESEKLYKSLVETSPDAICMLNLDGTIIYCNQRKADMFGYNKPEDLIGLNTFTLIDNEFQKLIPEMTKQLLETGQIQARELQFIKQNDERFWGEFRSKLIVDDAGNPRNAINILSDITERKKMQEAWQESEVRFRSAFEDAPIGMELISLQGSLMRVNKAFCELVGYTKEELENLNFRDFTYKDDLEDNENYVQKLISGEKDHVNFEKRYVRKDGKHIWVNVSASLFRNAYGLPQYFIAQVEDITHRKHLSEEIILAKNKAEESDKLKSALLANMSHELRTPMNGILGFTELIMQASVPNEVKDMAQMIDISGKRLLQTLDSIMLLAQLQSDSRSLLISTQAVNLSDEVSSVVCTMENGATDKGLKYHFDIEEKVCVEVEPKLIRNSILVLIENAIKYTHSGSISITLRTDIMDGNKFAIFSVKDTGIGIPSHLIETVFEEFRQVSEGYDRNYEGIGIGLSITKRIVELFNGHITAKSAPDKGSTFTIILPVCDEIVKDDKHINSKSGLSSLDIPDATLDRRILIVEDNMVNTKLLVHFLREYCTMIDCASTGEAAVDMAKTNLYDAILMDINLGSGIDGLQATQLIRQHERYQDTPIIAVTGYTMIGDEEKLIAGGCSHYIGKPFNQEKIIDVLKNVLPPMI